MVPHLLFKFLKFSLDKGIRKGWPLPLLLFFVVVKDLSISLKEDKEKRSSKWINVKNSCYIIHILFVYYEGYKRKSV
jgi:hypothetical protein